MEADPKRNSSYNKKLLAIEEKEVALATSLCYYLPHEDKCKRPTHTFW